MNEQDQINGQGQDNASKSDGQRARLQVGPLVVLTVWILIEVVAATCVLYRPDVESVSGALTYVVIGATAVGLAGWTTVWSTLSHDVLWVRFAYFLLGVGGLFIALFLAATEESVLIPEFAKLIVGVAVPLILVSRRGWRLAVNQRTFYEYGGIAVNGWQFSILDVFILTTGSATFIGLLLLNGPDGILTDFGLTSLFVSIVIATSTAASTIRPSLLAVGLVLVVLVAATPFLVEFVSAVTPKDFFPFGFAACVSAASLLIAAIPLRLCGYRLARR